MTAQRSQPAQDGPDLTPSSSLPETFSLLFPPQSAGSPTPQATLDPQAAKDLDIEKIIQLIDSQPDHRQVLREIFYRLCLDTDTIVYRQEIIHDLLAHPVLVETFVELLPKLDSLAYYAHAREDAHTWLHLVTWRAGELELLLDCIQALEQALVAFQADFHSPGLRQLARFVQNYATTESYQSLARELPGLIEQLRVSASLTIGVNLDEHLRPVEAVLLAVNKEPFLEASLLERMIGRTGAGQGIAPIHRLPMITRAERMLIPGAPMTQPAKRAEPMMVPLFRDLSEVIEKVTEPVAKALEKFARLKTRFLVNLRQDLVFYTAAVGLIHRIQDLGLPMTRPEILALRERRLEARQCYNLNLALHLGQQHEKLAGEIVPNDVQLSPEAGLQVLTGPNRGGKTTYMQALGLLQILGQAGLYVPAEQARLSPVDGIYTHYPHEERLERGTGRFGDEARRLAEIFQALTPHSLVLLNESLVGTNPGESLYLAQDILRVLQMVEVRAIFTTHLHELAASIDEFNGANARWPLISLVASRQSETLPDGSIRHSYRVAPGPPMGRSYADRIARQYGISYEQLLELLRQRGLLSEG